MTLTAIKDAIEKLPAEERATLASWLASVEAQAWDAQITKDFSPAGRGMKLLEQVDAQIKQGSYKPLESCF